MGEERIQGFPPVFAACPDIRHIFFNGAAAHQLYCRLVSKNDGRIHHRMPSTSPAYTMKFEMKLKIWNEAIKEALNESL